MKMTGPKIFYQNFADLKYVIFPLVFNPGWRYRVCFLRMIPCWATNLYEKSETKGYFWNIFGIGEKVISQSLLFFSQIVMMRVLSAKEYGQIGMLVIFMAVSMIFIDSGFGNALIQKKTVSGRDFSTAFWLNNIISSLCYIAIFISAPEIAAFYNDHELILLVRVLGINLFFCALGMVPQTILIKEMKFGSMARFSIWSHLISGLIGVVLVLPRCRGLVYCGANIELVSK